VTRAGDFGGARPKNFQMMVLLSVEMNFIGGSALRAFPPMKFISGLNNALKIYADAMEMGT